MGMLYLQCDKRGICNLLRHLSGDTGSETVVGLVVAGVAGQVQILVQEQGKPLVVVVA